MRSTRTDEIRALELEAIIRLFEEGLSQSEIAAKVTADLAKQIPGYTLSQPTVSRRLHSAGLLDPVLELSDGTRISVDRPADSPELVKLSAGTAEAYVTSQQLWKVALN